MRTLNARSQRVRPLLLALLWIWAGTVFLVLDLFLNVRQLDGVRPRAPLYQAMRMTAHDMVGEPLGGSRQAGAEAGGLFDALLRRTRDREHRLSAMRELTLRLEGAARDALERIVHDESEALEIRREAARLLGQTGDGALDLLEGIVTGTLPLAIREGAVLGLADVGTAPSAERILALVEDPALRDAALVALGRASTSGAIGVVAEAAENATLGTDARAAACRALAGAADGRAIDSLALVLGDVTASEDLVEAAAEALRSIAQRGIECHPLAELSEQAGSDPDPSRRASALREIADRLGPAGRAELMRALSDPAESYLVRREAARLLGRTGPAAVALLEDAIRSAPECGIRAAACLGLAELASGDAADRLLAFAGGPDPDLRSAALDALARTEVGEATPVLARAAAAPGLDAATRAAACRALGRSGLSSVVETLASVSRDPDAPPAVRLSAVRALGRLGGERSLPALAAACYDTSPDVVREAELAWRRASRG